VYHKEGSRFYGKTKKGKYVSESDAIKEGDRESKGDTESKNGTEKAH
jgi:Arc/MetJ-type ribon-helix-helix transcriptional regulator